MITDDIYQPESSSNININVLDVGVPWKNESAGTPLEEENALDLIAVEANVVSHLKKSAPDQGADPRQEWLNLVCPQEVYLADGSLVDVER